MEAFVVGAGAGASVQFPALCAPDAGPGVVVHPAAGGGGPRPGAHEQVLQVFSAELTRFPSWAANKRKHLKIYFAYCRIPFFHNRRHNAHKTNDEVATKNGKTNTLYLNYAMFFTSSSQ